MNPFTRDLSYGNVGKDVYKLQQLLEELGYGDFVPTGGFGTKTMGAVAQFQEDCGITPVVGYFGPKTKPVLLEKISDLHREKLYRVAIGNVGIDVTPEDIVPDEYDCANSVSTLLAKAGYSIGSYWLTTDMYRVLTNHSSWRKVDAPKRGDIVISPTGWGNGKLANGHVGFVSDNGKIMSNTSADGKFRENYTLESWRARYVGIGGFPMVYFRKL